MTVAVPTGPLLPLLGQDPNAPREVRLVGRYAIGIDWQDGHGSIFPYELLRASCPCAACAAPEATGAARTVGDAGVWPTEIKREGGGLRVRWADGHETAFGGRELRQLCRCATCTTRAD